MKTYVVAYKYEQFRDYVRNTGKPLADFIWLYDSDQLLGTSNPKVVYTGEYWKLKELEKIEKEIRYRTNP